MTDSAGHDKCMLVLNELIAVIRKHKSELTFFEIAGIVQMLDRALWVKAERGKDE